MITSPAIINPTTGGTNALLPGISLLAVHVLSVPGGQIQFVRQLISKSSTGLIGFSFLDLYIAINKKSRNGEICEDLLTVTDSICLELSSYVPLKESLKNQFKNCKNKDFRKAIMMFATKYELSELNIDEALNDLNNRFDILELDMFCNTIRQYTKVGNIIELLEKWKEEHGED